MTRADFRSGAAGQATRRALVAAGANDTWLASVVNLGGIEGFPFSEDAQSLVVRREGGRGEEQGGNQCLS